MIYTCKQDENFDPEILRQELVAAIGADGWHLNTAGSTVEFVGDAFDPEAVILAHFTNGPARAAAAATKVALKETDTQAHADAKNYATVQYFLSHTPAECRDKVAADVTNLATAVTMLQHFATMLCVLSRREFRK